MYGPSRMCGWRHLHASRICIYHSDFYYFTEVVLGAAEDGLHASEGCRARSPYVLGTAALLYGQIALDYGASLFWSLLLLT